MAKIPMIFEESDDGEFVTCLLKPSELPFDSESADNYSDYLGRPLKEETNLLSQLAYWYLVCSCVKNVPVKRKDFTDKLREAITLADINSLIKKGFVEEVIDEKGTIGFKINGVK